MEEHLCMTSRRVGSGEQISRELNPPNLPSTAPTIPPPWPCAQIQPIDSLPCRRYAESFTKPLRPPLAKLPAWILPSLDVPQGGFGPAYTRLVRFFKAMQLTEG